MKVSKMKKLTLGIAVIAAGIGLFILSRRQKTSGPQPIDQVLNSVAEDGKPAAIPQQKSNVLNPMGDNAQNLELFTSSPVKGGISDVHLLSKVRL